MHPQNLLLFERFVCLIRELILKAKTEEVLASYREYSEDNKYTYILEFFAGILSPADYSALKMSLYIRHQMDIHKDVGKLKADIRARFADRGANIANLCTAGYFEKYFIPLYNQLAIDNRQLTISKGLKTIFKIKDPRVIVTWGLFI